MGKATSPAAGNHKDGAAFNNLASEVAGAAKAVVLEVRDEALDLVEGAGDRVQLARGMVGDAIRERPFRAVGIALGIGCVIGLIVARR